MEELKILAQQKVRVKIGEENLTFKKITLGDYADLQAYLKTEYIKEQMSDAEAIYGDVPDDVKAEIRKSITPEKIEELSSSVKGMLFLITRAMQPTVKGITPEEVADMSMEMLVKIMDAIAPPEEEKKRKRTLVKKLK